MPKFDRVSNCRSIRLTTDAKQLRETAARGEDKQFRQILASSHREEGSTLHPPLPSLDVWTRFDDMQSIKACPNYIFCCSLSPPVRMNLGLDGKKSSQSFIWERKGFHTKEQFDSSNKLKIVSIVIKLREQYMCIVRVKILFIPACEHLRTYELYLLHNQSI